MDLALDRRSRRGALFAVALVAALLGLTSIASSARGAELLYWNNYGLDNVAFANIDGSGGGALNLTGAAVENPEGMAIDTVTGRLFVVSSGGEMDKNAGIVAVRLDGGGAAPFVAPGAPVNGPEGLALDPVTRTIYWANTNPNPDTISWAKLDGSAGGMLNTTGATVAGLYRLTVDPVGGRVYWGNVTPGGASISYASVNGTGGGDLALTGATPPKDISGLAVDNAANRIYWLDNESTSKRVSFASLAGGGGGDLNMAGATFDQGYGLAVDPTVGKAYWGNYGQGVNRIGAIGFAALANTGGGGINIATAPLGGAQDPLVLKSPAGTGAPAVTRAKNVPTTLNCSTGSWAADFAGSFVYQAPTTYAYQWTRNGKAVAGATAATLKATKAGKYACVVTAANQAGATAQTSKTVEIKAPKAKLTTKKKVTVKAGGTATFPIKIANQGDLKSKNAKLCVLLPKASKGALKAPKCKALGKLKGKGKKSAKLKIKALPSASGVYSVSFKVKGTAGKAAKAKIVVNG